MAADKRLVVDQGAGQSGHRPAIRHVAQRDADIAKQTRSPRPPDRALTKSGAKRLLIERQELIGSELDEIFAYADEAHPEKAAPFIRKPLVLPTMDELMKQNGANGHMAVLAVPMAVPEPVPGQPVPGPVPPIPVPPQPETLT